MFSNEKYVGETCKSVKHDTRKFDNNEIQISAARDEGKTWKIENFKDGSDEFGSGRFFKVFWDLVEVLEGFRRIVGCFSNLSSRSVFGFFLVSSRSTSSNFQESKQATFTPAITLSNRKILVPFTSTKTLNRKRNPCG
jgi:hypothetical protein